MNTKRKIQLIRALLLFLSVWPIAHFVGAKTIGIDPWKFCGFAMYTVPRFKPLINITGLDANIPYPLAPNRFSPDSVEAINRFVRKRQVYGFRYTPKAVARPVLEDYPECDGIRIVVSTLDLDREDGRIRRRVQTYDYHRQPETE